MTKFRNALHNEKGFTLIELLVVVIIIGILAAVALPNLMSASDSARDKRLEADFRTFQSGLEVYYNNYSQYPADQAGFESMDELKAVPQDPWGKAYLYELTDTTDKDNYKIKAGDTKAESHLTEDGVQPGYGN